MTTKITAQPRDRHRDFARRHNLPPATVDQLTAILDDHIAALAGHRRTLVDRWAEQARTDPEIGRNALPAALHAARQAVQRFGGDRLKKALEETGAGNHPEIIRAFCKVGRAMPAEPAPAPRRKPTHDETMRAMYPSMYGVKI